MTRNGRELDRIAVNERKQIPTMSDDDEEPPRGIQAFLRTLYAMEDEDARQIHAFQTAFIAWDSGDDDDDDAAYNPSDFETGTNADSDDEFVETEYAPFHFQHEHRYVFRMHISESFTE